MYTINALFVRCTLMILHLTRLKRQSKRLYVVIIPTSRVYNCEIMGSRLLDVVSNTGGFVHSVPRHFTQLYERMPRYRWILSSRNNCGTAKCFQEKSRLCSVEHVMLEEEMNLSGCSVLPVLMQIWNCITSVMYDVSKLIRGTLAPDLELCTMRYRHICPRFLFFT